MTVGGRTLHADLAARSIRKVVTTLLEHGEQNITLMIQGSEPDHVSALTGIKT